MNKIDLLKKINKAMSPRKVDFSALDKEVDTLKKSLEQTVYIQSLEDIERKLKQFQSKIDFSPIITEIKKIQEYVDNSTDIESSVNESLQDISNTIDSNNTANLEKIDSVKSEISSLVQGLSEDIKKVDSKNTSTSNSLTEMVRDIEQMEKDVNEVLETLQKNISGKSSKSELESAIDELRVDLLNRLSAVGSGNMNREIFIGGANPLTKYTDINLRAGSNVTITYVNNNTTKKVDVTVSATGGSGSGITRTIESVAVNTAAGDLPSIDYVYLVSGNTTITLPTAVGNSNLYTIKNVGTGLVTVATTGAETIDLESNIQMPIRYTSVDIISDSANWHIT